MYIEKKEEAPSPALGFFDPTIHQKTFQRFINVIGEILKAEAALSLPPTMERDAAIEHILRLQAIAWAMHQNGESNLSYDHILALINNNYELQHGDLIQEKLAILRNANHRIFPPRVVPAFADLMVNSGYCTQATKQFFLQLQVLSRFFLKVPPAGANRNQQLANMKLAFARANDEADMETKQIQMLGCLGQTLALSELTDSVRTAVYCSIEMAASAAWNFTVDNYSQLAKQGIPKIKFEFSDDFPIQLQKGLDILKDAIEGLKIVTADTEVQPFLSAELQQYLFSEFSKLFTETFLSTKEKAQVQSTM